MTVVQMYSCCSQVILYERAFTNQVSFEAHPQRIVQMVCFKVEYPHMAAWSHHVLFPLQRASTSRHVLCMLISIICHEQAHKLLITLGRDDASMGSTKLKVRKASGRTIYTQFIILMSGRNVVPCHYQRRCMQGTVLIRSTWEPAYVPHLISYFSWSTSVPHHKLKIGSEGLHAAGVEPGCHSSWRLADTATHD